MASRLLHAVFLLSSLAAADDVAAIAARLDTEGAREAAERLAELGPAAKAAVPQLVGALGSEDAELSWRAGWALSRMGREAAPAAQALVLAAMKKDGLPAAAACIALKRIGGAGTDAVLASMQQAPEEERRGYIHLLSIVEPKPEPTIPLVLPFLSGDARWNIETLLESMGRAAGPAVPALVRRLREDQFGFACGDTLVAIGEPSVAPLRELALDHTASTDVRGVAVGLLVRIGGPGMTAAQECLKEIVHGDVWNRFLFEVARAGPDAAEIVPPIEQRIVVRQHVPWGVAKALMALGPTGRAALERALFEACGPHRAELTLQLRDLECGTAVPWLLRLTDPAEPKDVRMAALGALAHVRLDGDAARRVAALVEPTFGEDQKLACDLAGSAGPAAGSLADKLRPLLEKGDPQVRIAAACALFRIGKASPAEAAIVMKAMEECKRSEYGYGSALERVADAGPSAAACWEILVPALDSDQTMVKLAAMRGLVRMLPSLGDERDRALAALTKARSAAWTVSELDDIPTLIDLLSLAWAAYAAEKRIHEIGSRAWGPLVERLDDLDQRARCRAALLLLRIDLERAEERLWPVALESSVPDDLADLCRAKRQVAIPILMQMLSSNQPGPRASAATLLGQLEHAGAAPSLRQLIAGDPDDDVRTNALWALDAVLQAP